MDLKGILSISGYGGLFKLIKQTKSGFVVESLIDKKRMQAFATSKISTLDDIAIYTEDGEVHLKEILKKIFEKEDGKETINHKSGSEDLKKFFIEILPDYDRERVYVSDIKKVINWYNILVGLDMVDLEDDVEGDTESSEKEDLKSNEIEVVEEKEEENNNDSKNNPEKE
ncbi:MAG: hypothetical protein B6I20_00560 [Bacteroidetes bacterium 4572_117]|nr:MAG: hypothetical protein B6I20_00560 [Bacteroidetes bacterium 4572_117]